MNSFVRLLAASSLAAAPVWAQTYSSCNPMDETGCSPDTALGTTLTVDFTQGESDYFTTSGDGSIKYTSSGLELTINEEGDAPTLTSTFYIFWGKVEMECIAAPGTGIVSSLVLESDDLDEVDYEWLGGDTTQVQSNYFGKGNTTSYDRGAYHSVNTPQTTSHTYTIEYTSEEVTWSVDGAVVRTLLYADAVDGTNFPQTPMMIKMGIWAGGDSSNSEGTIEWAGGETDYSDAPFTMTISSMTITDYSTGASEYVYGDKTGDYSSIEIIYNSTSSDSSATATATKTSTASSDSADTTGASVSGSSATFTYTSSPKYTSSISAVGVSSATGTPAPINSFADSFYSFNNATTNSTNPSNSSSTSSASPSSSSSAAEFTSNAAPAFVTSWSVVCTIIALGAVFVL